MLLLWIWLLQLFRSSFVRLPSCLLFYFRRDCSARLLNANLYLFYLYCPGNFILWKCNWTFTNSSRLPYTLLDWVVIAIVLLKLILYSGFRRLFRCRSLIYYSAFFTIRAFNKSFCAKRRRKHWNVSLIRPLDFYQAAIINYNNYFFFFSCQFH